MTLPSVAVEFTFAAASPGDTKVKKADIERLNRPPLFQPSPFPTPSGPFNEE